MIADGLAEGTHCEGNSIPGGWAGGAGWIYVWSIIDEHVKWRYAKQLRVTSAGASLSSVAT